MFLAKKENMPPVHVNNLGTLVEKFKLFFCPIVQGGSTRAQRKRLQNNQKSCTHAVLLLIHKHTCGCHQNIYKKNTTKIGNGLLLLIMVDSILLIQKILRGFIFAKLRICEVS